MRKLKARLLPALALMLIGAIFLSGTAAASSDDYGAETLSVDGYYITGDTLVVTIRDKATGTSHVIELSLSEHVDPRDELIIIQATDAHGNISHTVQFRNPLFSPDAGQRQSGTSSAPDFTAGNPLTPDGTGEVVDNATEDEGKEFFSITTENGNIFYLIVDRQRNIDNVYLLSSVTEHELMALAQPGDGNISAIPPMPAEPPETMPPEEPAPQSVPEESGNSGTFIFILIAAAAVAGAAYYFKIVKPKKDNFDDDFGTELEEDSAEPGDNASFEANEDDPNQD
jgi:hypothetical protein